MSGNHPMSTSERAAAVSAAAAALMSSSTSNGGGASNVSGATTSASGGLPATPATGSHPSLSSLVGSNSRGSGGMIHHNNKNNNPSVSRTSTAAAPISNPPKVRHCAALTTAMLNQNHHPSARHLSSPDAVHCVACGFAGSDLRIRGCSAQDGCAFHARCIDLVGLCNRQQSSNGDNIVIAQCPKCNGAAKGLEILPLSFLELDRAQQRLGLGKKALMMGGGFGASAAAASALKNGVASSGSSGNNMGNNELMAEGMSRKRSSDDLTRGNAAAAAASASYPSNVNLACRAANVGAASVPSTLSLPPASGASQCYDPAVPRTGRWTDEELAFRDAIIARFLDGSLPLSNGLKLNDFLSNMLKSKQSRLTKKMKHAKLSTKYFRIKSGYLGPADKAREFSTLEFDFVNAIADPVERTEIQFHMQKEWRDHLAERCTYLRIQFDAEDWLKSVDAMDRRVALEKNRSRMVKRRCLMGKAMEKDLSESTPGVFINQVVDQRGEDFLHKLEVKSRSNSLGGGGISGMGDENRREEEDGDFGRLLMSMLDEAPVDAFGHGASLPSHTGHATKKSSIRSSYCDPNFRYAAPFLAGMTSYMERNCVPFEHVDIWVPSTVPPALENEGKGSMGSAPMIPEMGSGSSGNLTMMDDDNDGSGTCRLCFAGSATLAVQIIDEPAASSSSSEKASHEMTKKFTTLTSDEIFNFSLYGDYSEKFSFSAGCGLPGRVYQTGVAAWEQFLPNAPPEMFERRGGAIQFGIKTALGLPIDSPNVGRIVVVLYSKHNREKDEDLVNQMVKDVKLFHPCPRWKLVVEVRSLSNSSPGKEETKVTSPVQTQPIQAPPPASGMANSTSCSAGMSALSMQPATTALGMDLGEPMSPQISAPAPTQSSQNFSNNVIDTNKNSQIVNLVSLLQENMPSDHSSPLGKQLNSIMSLRMILLRSNRTSEEEQLVETILVLFESYVAAGRSRLDIALLVTRDYDFHIQHQQRMAMMNPQPNVGPTEHSQMIMQGPQSQLLLHNFNQAAPLGGRPETASATSNGSFLPQPVHPFAAGGVGVPLPVLQNVVHPPYTLQPEQPGGTMPLDVPLQQGMALNGHPSNYSMPSSKKPPNQ
eukprot:CAMPEP_0183742376 /NCGR_PEP_ID=MMETSP0737-20130205/64590_1 /TAXON_ID=385413 /ORGANISM="Thalassiosira miniscula, Strain CCMP1093" /LENGTH=1103 /DNA_ID=CAMNT_0025977957 /DNA_START=214 /DNA_END=3525 /DNA_ORIENTATION=-